MPLYVREGSIHPLGPVKQHTGEELDQPYSISIYPGKDSEFLLYEDDGVSFNYRKGEWMGVTMAWNEAKQTLQLHLADGSRMLPPLRRSFEVRLFKSTKAIAFDGKPVSVSF
jgi:alpha-glucosidase (family GH31 glycosyl hydrolase)